MRKGQLDDHRQDSLTIFAKTTCRINHGPFESWCQAAFYSLALMYFYSFSVKSCISLSSQNVCTVLLKVINTYNFYTKLT